MMNAMSGALLADGMGLRAKEKKMKAIMLGFVAAIVLLATAGPATAQGRKLTDEELGKVSAGSASAKSTDGVVKFNFEGQAGSTHTVKGTGMIQVKEGALPLLSSKLILQDNAQQNLRSLVNIVAVNSKVQVLVNLNININSTVGAVHQVNASLGH